MDTKRICPSCQKALPPDVPMGLCPECLIKSGFATGTDPAAGAEAAGSRFIPPSVAEIARLFPQFEILDFIGKGGMGAVYKARQPALDRFIALKILNPATAGDPGFAERFNREARALARLNHPNIVAVHDFGKVGQASSLSPDTSEQTGRMPVPLHYLVMEFVDGANLREVERAGRLSPEQALSIVPQICEALQFAHNEGIVHRDIKPENLLIDKKGRVKITDFGIAKIVGITGGKVSLTGAKDVVGTPHYMAPEQIEKPQTVDHRADIYSLGVVFYEMLTGELPLGRFQPPSSCAGGVQIDVRLDEVVLRALEKEPARRYQQVSEVKTRVETIASSAAAAGTPPHQTPFAPKSAASEPDGPPLPKARPLVAAPAITMMVISGFNIAGLLFGLFLAGIISVLPRVFGAGASHFMFPGWGTTLPAFLPSGMMMGVAVVIVMVWMLVWLAAAVVSFMGALRMYQLRHHRLAIASGVILIVMGLLGLVSNSTGSTTGMWSLLQLGAGIWALVVLIRSDVKNDFAGRESVLAQARSRTPTTPEAASVESARKQVSAPALGLMVASGINLLVLGAALLFLLIVVKWRYVGGADTVSISGLPGISMEQTVRPGSGVLPRWMLFGPSLLLFAMCPALLTFVGAWRMRQLRGYGLAVTGALLAIILSQGFVLGLVFGVWAIVVLLRREVREAFISMSQTRGRAPDGNSAGRIIAIVCGVVGLLGVLVLTVLFLGSVLHMNRAPAIVALLFPVGLVLVLVAALVIGLILFLRRKNTTGTGKALAIGCGVLGLGAFAVLLLMLASLVWARTRAVTMHEPARQQAMRQMAELEHLTQERAASGQHLTFGPVVERLLLFNTNGLTDAVGLESNEIVTLPSTRLPPPLIAFVDDTESNVVYLKSNWRASVVPVKNQKWDAVTPAMNVEKTASPGNLETIVSVTKSDLPATFLFRTDSRFVGALQVSGLSDGKDGITIRYKFVTQSSTNAVFALETSSPNVTRAVPLEAAKLFNELLELQSSKIPLYQSQDRSSQVKLARLEMQSQELGHKLRILIKGTPAEVVRQELTTVSQEWLKIDPSKDRDKWEQLQKEMQIARFKEEQLMAEAGAADLIQPHAGRLQFGHWIEVALLHPSAGRDCCINFDSGAVLTPPPEILTAMTVTNRPGKDFFEAMPESSFWAKYRAASKDTNALARWIEDSSVDVVTLGSYGLVVFCPVYSTMPINEAGNNREWEGQITPPWLLWKLYSAEKMKANPRSANTYEVLTFPSGAADSTNALCLFRTRSGNLGLLQITGFTDNPRGVNIRYKLLEATASSRPDETNHQHLTTNSPVQALDPLLMARANDMRKTLLAAAMYADSNNGEWPARLSDLGQHAGPSFIENVSASLEYYRPKHLIVATNGSMDAFANPVLFEKIAASANGEWVGCADGHLVFVKDAARLHELRASVREAEPPRNLIPRYEAANSISSFVDRDKLLAAIAKDAARIGDWAMTRKALGKISAFTTRDDAAYEAAQLLARFGRRAEAMDIAKTISESTKRDAALRELAE